MLELSRKKKRLLEIVRAVALTSPGVGGRNGNNFRIGAIVVRRNSVINAGVNSYRSSSRLFKFYRFPHFHAEASAILRSGFDSCYGSDLYVARVLRNNGIALAKPCKECQELIKLAGIRNVYYSTNEGSYEKL